MTQPPKAVVPRHQQASVVLGYDKGNYTTTNKSRTENVPVTQSMTTLTRGNKSTECHLTLGEPGQRRDFSKASTQLDPTGEMHKYTAKLNATEKKFLLKTSSSFGSEPVDYTTSAALATKWDKEAMQETIRIRNDLRKQTGSKPTRGMSFDEEIEYVSESKSMYVNKFKEYKPSQMAEAVKKDLRATHYTLGHEKLEYNTSSHIPPLSPQDFAKYGGRQPPLHDLRKSTVQIS